MLCCVFIDWRYKLDRRSVSPKPPPQLVGFSDGDDYDDDDGGGCGDDDDDDDDDDDERRTTQSIDDIPTHSNLNQYQFRAAAAA